MRVAAAGRRRVVPRVEVGEVGVVGVDEAVDEVVRGGDDGDAHAVARRGDLVDVLVGRVDDVVELAAPEVQARHAVGPAVAVALRGREVDGGEAAVLRQRADLRVKAADAVLRGAPVHGERRPCRRRGAAGRGRRVAEAVAVVVVDEALDDLLGQRPPDRGLAVVAERGVLEPAAGAVAGVVPRARDERRRAVAGHVALVELRLAALGVEAGEVLDQVGRGALEQHHGAVAAELRAVGPRVRGAGLVPLAIDELRGARVEVAPVGVLVLVGERVAAEQVARLRLEHDAAAVVADHGRVAAPGAGEPAAGLDADERDRARVQRVGEDVVGQVVVVGDEPAGLGGEDDRLAVGAERVAARVGVTGREAGRAVGDELDLARLHVAQVELGADIDGLAFDQVRRGAAEEHVTAVGADRGPRRVVADAARAAVVAAARQAAARRARSCR